MALSGQGFVEIRDTGAADNGAWWSPTVVGAGTDYSQSDTPICSGNDGDCNNSTTFTANGSTPFTAQMVGNGIHISGTGYTTGFYEIRTFNSTSSIVLDRNPTSAGGHPTTGAYKVGGACTTIDAPLVTSLPTAAMIHIKKGTYTFAGCTLPTNSISPFTMQGYKTTRGDNPQGSDRPSITMSGSLVCGAANNVIKDCIITGNFNANVVSLVLNSQIVNCKVTQLNGTANVTCIAGGGNTGNGCIGCEVVCAAGRAVNGVCFVQNCYIHDSDQCYYINVSNTIVEIHDCVIDTGATDGIFSNTTGRVNISGCTIYNCSDGIHSDANVRGTYINNIVTGCTVGIRCSFEASIIANNVLNNSTNITGITSGNQYNTTIANPLLKDPANGDFTIQTASPAKSAALQMNTNLGTVGIYYKSIGVSEIAPFLGQIMSVA